MKFKEIKHGIIAQSDCFLVHIKTYYFGIHWISEVLTNQLTGEFEVFGSFEGAQDRIKELNGKGIKKKLKLFKKFEKEY